MTLNQPESDITLLLCFNFTFSYKVVVAAFRWEQERPRATCGAQTASARKFALGFVFIFRILNLRNTVSKYLID